jgi:hypothetical protein
LGMAERERDDGGRTDERRREKRRTPRDSRLARVSEVLVLCYIITREEGEGQRDEGEGGGERRREAGREGDTGRTDIGLVEGSGDL